MNKSKTGKKLLSLLLSVLMCLSFVPTVAFATEETATTVSTEQDLISALTNGGSIILADNIELTAKQTITKDVTIDLNGKTISSTVNEFLTVSGGSLTVNDSGTTGKIENTATSGWCKVIKMTGGTFTLNGGTVLLASTDSYSQTIHVAIGKKSVININGGKVERTSNATANAIELGTNAEAVLNVNGGEISATGYGIKALNLNTVNVTGGKIGNITVAANATLSVGKESGLASDVTVTNIYFSSAKAKYYFYSGTVEGISGENCKNLLNKDSVPCGADKFLIGKDITSLLGADFKCVKYGDTKYFYIADLSAENAPATVTSANGTVTDYNTVEQAYDNLKDGETLTLKADYTGKISTTAKNVTVDLGGHTLTPPSTDWSAVCVNFNQSTASNNTVTVKNGKIIAKGQGQVGIQANMTDNGSDTLTVNIEDVVIETLTTADLNECRYGAVRLNGAARIEGENAGLMNRGGLQVTEEDGTYIYGSTATAFAHAKGTEVRLLNDWYSDSGYVIELSNDSSVNTAILNLGGKTIKQCGYDGAILLGANKESEGTAAKELTVKNGTIVSWKHCASVHGSNKTLILEDVSFTSTDDKCYGIYTNGMTEGNTVTLKNSTVVSEKATGIYFAGAGNLTVENTSVTGAVSAIEARAGIVDISGNSILESTADKFEFGNNDNGTTTTGAALAAVKHCVGNDLTVNISGGAFKGIYGLYVNDPNPDKTGKVAISVSGGTFKTEIKPEWCADEYFPVTNEDGTYGVKGPYAAKIGSTGYDTLQAAFDAAKTGDTVTLLTDITLTERVNITKALNGLTLDGNGKTITCATTDDPFKSGGSALYFGNANDKLYCTGIKIKDLNMVGKARFAIFLCGGTTTEFTNVNISGEYYIAVNLYGTHGATMTNCNISNSTTGTDKYISGVWSNVASANPLTLNDTTVDVIAINAYTTKNTLAPKILINEGSKAEIHTFDDGSVSCDKFLCVNKESKGEYSVKEFVEAISEWVDATVAEVGGVKYATLAAAIAAAKDGETVTLLSNCSGDGIRVPENKYPKGLTIDFAGHSYTVGGVLVGSSGTASNGFQLLKGNKITMKNGSIYGDKSVAGDDKTDWSGAPAILIQNYSDLTLDGMTVAGGEETAYTLSNNNGDTVIKDSKIIAGKGTRSGGPFAFDVCRFGSAYPSVSVTVKGNSEINGRVEISGEIGAGQSRQLNIENGTFNGNFEISENVPANIAISGGKFANEIKSDWCANGFIPTKNSDGTYGVTPKAVTGKKALTVVNAGRGEVDYLISGGMTGTWKDGSQTSSYEIGTRITLTAKADSDSEFLYWKNSEGRILTDSETYTFYISDDITVTAVFYRTGETAPYVVFRDISNKVLFESRANSDGTIEVPDFINYAGSTFKGWFDSEGNEYEVVNGKITVSGTENVTVYAKYVTDSETYYTVYIDGVKYKEYLYGSNVTVTAPTKEGQKFAGWYVGNVLVSYDQTYSFYITGDIRLETKYSDTEVEKKPVVSLIVSERSNLADGRQSVIFTESWSADSSYTFVSAGMLYTLNPDLTLDLENSNQSGVYKTDTLLRGNSGTYAYTLTMSTTSKLKTVYVRAYFTYIKDGQTVTVYTDVQTSPAN